MDRLLSTVKIQVNPNTYLKDPDSSELGRKIISGSIELLHEIGFEHFTFKKLAKAISSTEASIYRYFENKYKILLFLNSWYWGWMEYRLVFGTANIADPLERYMKAVKILTEGVNHTSSSHINEEKLYDVIISEASKAYLTREVDTENSKGVFLKYKRVVERVSEMILVVNPKFKYSHMLVSTIIEGAYNQRYFSLHLPRLTDVVEGEDSIVEFFQQMAVKAIK